MEEEQLRQGSGEPEAHEGDVGLITRDTDDAGVIAAASLDMGVLEPQPRWEGWETYVSQKSVRAIAMAPRSQLMWLATWGGVLSSNRRDPLYRRYSSEHGLAGNTVCCLCVDDAERPWAGHPEGGLSYFASPYWQVYDHLQEEAIRAVCPAREGKGIWAAGERLLYHIPGPDQEPKLAALAHDGTTRLEAMLDEGGSLLLGNAWGLFRLRPRAAPEAIAPSEIPGCTALARDGSGAVWVASGEAVYRLEGDAVRETYRGGPEERGRVLALAAGRRWVWAWTTAGLAQIKAGRWSPVRWHDVERAPPRIQAIAVGSSDDYLWLGTDDLLQGVLAMGPDASWDLRQLPHHEEDVLSNLGRCAARSHPGGTVWVGTAGGLLTFGPGEGWSWVPDGDVRAVIPGLPGAAPWRLTWPGGIRAGPAPGPQTPPGLPLALAQGQDGRPYVLTGRGLWQLGDGAPRERSTAPPEPVRCLAQTPDGQWWLGTVRGVYSLAEGRWSLAGEQPGPVQSGVRALSVVDGTLWAATETGLWARQGAGWQEHPLGGPAGPGARAIAASAEAGRLWVARQDGVVCYDPASGTASEPYTPANSGLASRRVAALVEDSGFLYVVTEAGTSRLKL